MISAPKVTILDYGLGNIFSVSRAFESAGAEVTIATQPASVRAADRLILPGVGAFENGMDGLRKHGLVHSIKEFAASGRPFLGICLGMQMMLETSKEFGEHPGLGLIEGEVLVIPERTPDGNRLKVPHIGWNELRHPEEGPRWDGTMLAGTPASTSVYFVHSFSVHLKNRDHLLAEVDYGGHPIVAALRSGSLYGCQFHPERSGPAGLDMIRTFLKL